MVEQPDACPEIPSIQNRDECPEVWGLRGLGVMTRAVSWDDAELSVEWVSIWRRKEGHCGAREQLELMCRCTELQRNKEKKEACVVGCVKASTLSKMVFLLLHWKTGVWATLL